MPFYRDAAIPKMTFGFGVSIQAVSLLFSFSFSLGPSQTQQDIQPNVERIDIDMYTYIDRAIPVGGSKGLC
jgi:hypothetical protein